MEIGQNTDNMAERYKEWANSDVGKEYFDKMNKSLEIRNQRHKKFEKYLETHDFDKLMYRLINEHNDDYIDKCYHQGYEPYPNNKLSFILGYVTIYGKPIKVKEIESDFPNNIWLFNGYYFQNIYGQGTVLRIYNKEDMKLLLQL